MSDDRKIEALDRDGIPSHLKHWPGLFVRENGKITEASPEDQEVASGYPGWPDKGLLIGGRRITLMARKANYGANDEIRVIHVYEVIIPGEQVYVVGPKPVYGEYLDGKLSTPKPPADEDPFAPRNYDGRVVPSPAVDYNYDITRYKLTSPGRHRIHWEVGGLLSNTLEFEQT